jgi:outer membrane protein
MKKCLYLWAVGSVLVGSVTNIQAQTAGSWMARIGGTLISPNVSSGDLSPPSVPGSKIDINNASSLSGGLTYMVTDQVSLDLPLSLPFKHQIVGAGTQDGVGTVIHAKSFPVTVFAQYRFLNPTSAFRPYVGVGLTYARFYQVRSTASLSAMTGGEPTLTIIDSKFAFTPQIGFTYFFNEEWFADFMVAKTFLRTNAMLTRSGQTTQTLSAKLDPWAFSLGLGYKF